MVYGYEDMKASSYPYDPAQEIEDKKKTYLVFQLSKRDIEPEFLKYKWNPNDIPQLHGHNATRLTAIKLTELMKFAKTLTARRESNNGSIQVLPLSIY